MMHINVNGDDIPDPIENLSQLYADCENDDEFHKLYQMRRCPKQLLENFKGYKFKELTPVQMQVLPIMLNVWNFDVFMFLYKKLIDIFI